jgi:hypothetical protein
MIESLAFRRGGPRDLVEMIENHLGYGIGWPDAPSDLLDALHVRAPASPFAKLALDVATAAKRVFDGLRRRLDLQLTHASFAEGPAEDAHLLLGVYSPRITAHVRAQDTVSAGVLVALRGDPGGNGCATLEVLGRIFRKVCENGAVIHDHDDEGARIDTRLLWTRRDELGDALEERIVAALDIAAFATHVETIRRGADEVAGGEILDDIPDDLRRRVADRFHASRGTRWNIANALTAEARWAATAAEAIRLERLGALVACPPQRRWAAAGVEVEMELMATTRQRLRPPAVESARIKKPEIA